MIFINTRDSICYILFPELPAPEGYKLAMKVEDTRCHYLKAVTTTSIISFDAARAACQADGGDLVIDNKGKEWHDFLVSFAKQEFKGPWDRCWLGATDQAKEGVFRWVDGKFHI